eukprot:CAMPEP_0185021416 /NCGR_PEP_ID=MMETSP1103-20130426/4106_1 /TAXON_ID=36769 /ORGANISM="Paraphysomonas bandaiensis, Strain Caron Lab Isolate" /LENGTH=43 /DNA_ID= /DNA_START= /DNA_END= /DNA_ORIENTATION=
MTVDGPVNEATPEHPNVHYGQQQCKSKHPMTVECPVNEANSEH